MLHVAVDLLRRRGDVPAVRVGVAADLAHVVVLVARDDEVRRVVVGAGGGAAAVLLRRRRPLRLLLALVQVDALVVLVGLVDDLGRVLVGALAAVGRVVLVLELGLEEGDDAVGQQVAPEGEARGALAERLGLVVVLGHLVRRGGHVVEVEAEGAGVDLVGVVGVDPDALGLLEVGPDGVVAEEPGLAARVARVAVEGARDLLVGYGDGSDAESVIFEVAQHDVVRISLLVAYSISVSFQK
ncbi:hypothetical protein PG990_001765 [Apiospora arundinis]